VAQELEFPIDKIGFVEWRDKSSIWVVELEDEDVFMECTLFAANTEKCFVCCENIFGVLPNYVVPMKPKNE